MHKIDITRQQPADLYLLASRRLTNCQRDDFASPGV